MGFSLEWRIQRGGFELVDTSLVFWHENTDAHYSCSQLCTGRHTNLIKNIHGTSKYNMPISDPLTQTQARALYALTTASSTLRVIVS